MRIIHLEASTGWGGQEMRILSEAKGMRQRGHEIFFVVEKEAKLEKKQETRVLSFMNSPLKNPFGLFPFFILSIFFVNFI